MSRVWKEYDVPLGDVLETEPEVKRPGESRTSRSRERIKYIYVDRGARTEKEEEKEEVWWSDSIPIPDILTALAPLFWLYRINYVTINLRPRKEPPVDKPYQEEEQQ